MCPSDTALQDIIAISIALTLGMMQAVNGLPEFSQEAREKITAKLEGKKKKNKNVQWAIVICFKRYVSIHLTCDHAAFYQHCLMLNNAAAIHTVSACEFALLCVGPISSPEQLESLH